MKIALFVDFDNVYSGLRRISGEAAERFSRQPLRWLQWLTAGSISEGLEDPGTEKRRVLVRRCYLNPVMYQKYRRPFHEAGFEIVDCPPMTATGKTSTDIHLVLDTMDALMDETHFDEFIVFSADADFSPVLRRLRRHDRRTVVFAAGAMSESYKASADRVIDIQTFLSDALQLAPADDDSESIGVSTPSNGMYGAAELRKRVAECVRDKVLRAEQPVRLPALASLLNREFPSLRESQWDGAGTFSNLMRQLGIPDISFDFDGDIANDQNRMGTRLLASAAPPASAPTATSSSDIDTDTTAAEEPLPPNALREVAESIVKRAVADSKGPVHLAILGQILRREIPQLSGGWAGASNLAAFLHQLRIDPLQQAVLDNGTTNVLYDPSRHDPPLGVVGDKLVVGMLRAAELPEMKGADLIRILIAARSHMGSAEPFEISEVSRGVTATLAQEGNGISPRRVANVLQALIFGGLDATRTYEETQDLAVAAMGVILSAWARETQATADDDARGRLLTWLGPTHVNSNAE